MSEQAPAPEAETTVINGLALLWLDSAGRALGRAETESALLAAYRAGFSSGVAYIRAHEPNRRGSGMSAYTGPRVPIDWGALLAWLAISAAACLMFALAVVQVVRAL